MRPGRWSTGTPAAPMPKRAPRVLNNGWRKRPATEPHDEPHAARRSPGRPGQPPRHATRALPARLLAEASAADPQRIPRLRLADRTRGSRRPGLRGDGAVAPDPPRPRQGRLAGADRPVPGRAVPDPGRARLDPAGPGRRQM